MSSAISVRDVKKRYVVGSSGKIGLRALFGGPSKGDRVVEALKGVSFELPRGQALGIVGRNGSGKSTLLRIVCGISSPTEGAVELQGRAGALIELGVGFHPDYTGRENLLFGGQVLGISAAEMRELEPAILEFAGIGDAIDRPLGTYSSGMSVRLGFAMATAIKPEVLIVDEVLAVGDAAFQLRCYARMEQFISGGGTLLLVSHDLTAITRMCNRALWLDRGNLRADGEPFEVVRQYTEALASEQIEREAQEGKRRLQGLLRGSGEAKIDRVEFFAGDDPAPTTVLRTGAPVRMRVIFTVIQTVPDACAAVSFYRTDGLVATQTISTLDGVRSGPLGPGTYTFEATYPFFQVQPCELSASVAIMPPFDPRERGLLARYDAHSRAYSLRVEAEAPSPAAYVHPVRWEVR